MTKSEQKGSPVLYGWMQFPVVWIGVDDVRVFIDLDHLRTIDNVSLEDRCRTGGCIVDSRLNRRSVDSVRVVGHVPPFWGYRLPGMRISVLDYDFAGETTRISLDELKKLIIRARRAYGYKSMMGSPRRYEAEIRRLGTFEAIVKRFQIGPKRGWTRKFWAGALD